MLVIHFPIGKVEDNKIKSLSKLTKAVFLFCFLVKKIGQKYI